MPRREVLDRPVRRELLVDLDAIIARSFSTPRSAIASAEGSPASFDEPRYGLPFAGDNNLLFDRLDLLASPSPAHWYTPMRPGDPPRRGSCRLTVGIDRADSSRTTTVLCAPTEETLAEPPEAAWIWTPRAPDGSTAKAGAA